MTGKNKTLYAGLACFVALLVLAMLASWSYGRLEVERRRATADPYARDLARAELASAELPGPIFDRIRAAPELFFTLMSRIENSDPSLFLPVGPAFPIPGDEPGDLVPVPADTLARGERGLKLRQPALLALTKMKAAATASEVDLRVTSSYRTLGESKEIYASFAASLGAEAAAQRVALPGRSQHHLGTALDFSPTLDGFKLTRQGRWLLRNAWTYGFSLSYPWGGEEITGYVFESWHYRYLGADFCLLEKLYFGDMQHYALEFLAKW